METPRTVHKVDMKKKKRPFLLSKAERKKREYSDLSSNQRLFVHLLICLLKERAEGRGKGEMSTGLRNENSTSSSAHLTSLPSATRGHETRTQTREAPSARAAWSRTSSPPECDTHAHTAHPRFCVNPDPPRWQLPSVSYWRKTWPPECAEKSRKLCVCYLIMFTLNHF